MKRKKKWKNLGFDESNHGLFPEIFVLAFSNSLQDSIISPTSKFPKQRKSHNDLGSQFSHKKYAFLMLSQLEAKGMKSHQILGNVLTSLLYEEHLKRPLNLVIDGRITYRKKDYLFGCLKDYLFLPRKEIHLRYGGNMDRRNRLVNLADAKAHHLLMAPLNALRVNPNRKYLLESIIK